MEAAFFDLDKTVIDRASIAAFGRPFMKGGLINRRVVARAAFSQLIYLYFGADEERLVRVRESMLAMTKGWDRDQVRQIVRETMLETIEPIMYAEALELMELHRAAGHRVYLVSASPEEIVLPLADLLGVDGAICSRGEVDEQGRYTGRMAFYAYGAAKATAMRELAERTGIDLGREQRLLGLGHRPAHARGGRPARSGEPRPRPGQGGARSGAGRCAISPSPIRLRDRVGRTTPVVTTSLAVAGAALSCGGAACAAATPRPARPPRGLSRSADGSARASGASGVAQATGGDDTEGDDQSEDAGASSWRRQPEPCYGRSGAGRGLRRSAGRGRRCPTTGGAAWTWPAPRSGGCAHGSG